MGIFIGIDTDSRGSMALVDFTQGLFAVYLLPNTTIKVNGKNRNILDVQELGRLMRALAPHSPNIQGVTMEQQAGLPEQDSSSTFFFGKTVGQIEAALHTACPQIVAPRWVRGVDWKGSMKLSSDKAEARALAAKLFPNAAPIWRRGFTTERTSAAEALLLALWGAVKTPLAKHYNRWPGEPLVGFQCLN